MRSLVDQLRAPDLAGGFLPDEQIAHAARVFVRLDYKSPLRLLGAAGHAIQRAEQAARNPLPFALADRMAIALTSRRLLFWSYVGVLMWAGPRRLLGGLELDEVVKVEVSGRRRTLSFWLTERTLELGVKDRDLADARALAAALAPSR